MSSPDILVRTLRGDLFEFPCETTEDEIRQVVADYLGVDRALLLLRSFPVPSHDSSSDDTVNDDADDDEKTDGGQAKEYLAIVEAHRDTCAWFIYQRIAIHSYTGSIYRVGTAADHLPERFYLGHMFATETSSNQDEFQWSVDEHPVFSNSRDSGDSGDSRDSRDSGKKTRELAPTWPTIRACIENFCATTGWPLPCILFLEQIDTRFGLYERLTAIRECGWRVGGTHAFVGCRRRVLATLRRLQIIDPLKDWVAMAHAPRMFRNRGEWSMADPHTYLEKVMGFPQEEAEEFGLYARWWC